VGIPSVLGSIRVSCLPISIGGVCWVLKRFELFYSMCCLLSNSVPPTLYYVLWGSGSALFKGSERYVIILCIHGVSSPVITYRRCNLESWSACTRGLVLYLDILRRVISGACEARNSTRPIVEGYKVW